MTIDIEEGGKRLPVGQRPLLPGSPGSPVLSVGRKIIYGFVAIIVGLTGGLGNALVTVNLPQLQGSLGLYIYEISWLPTAYAMTYVWSSLLLIKLRIQFGLRPFALIFVGAYAVATFAHLFVHGFAMAIIVRGASGVASSALNSLTIYYVMQAAPSKWRIKSVAIGLGIPQLAIPIARLFSTELLALGEWRALYCFELGLALFAFASVLLMPLPPSEKSKGFERLDFVTFPLLAVGLALLCAVLGLGKAVWWTDVAWVGWACAIAIPLIGLALVIEHHRTNPLLATRWLASSDIVRFIIVSIMFKIASSEQTSGAVGLLNIFGLNNDQLHPLFTIILIATAAGSIVSMAMITMDVKSTVLPIVASVGLCAVGSFLDFGATNLTRPHQFFFTQALVAFASTLFLAPSLLFGLGRALAQGRAQIISFIGLFGLIQTIGGLVGSALISTFEVVREKAYSNGLVQDIVMTNPLVAGRLQAGNGIYNSVVGDPALRSAESVALLGRQTTLEANVLAYNDVFLLVGALATATMIYLAIVIGLRKTREFFPTHHSEQGQIA